MLRHFFSIRTTTMREQLFWETQQLLLRDIAQASNIADGHAVQLIFQQASAPPDLLLRLRIRAGMASPEVDRPITILFLITAAVIPDLLLQLTIHLIM